MVTTGSSSMLPSSRISDTSSTAKNLSGSCVGLPTYSRYRPNLLVSVLIVSRGGATTRSGIGDDGGDSVDWHEGSGIGLGGLRGTRGRGAGSSSRNRRGRPGFLRQPRPRCSDSSTAGVSLALVGPGTLSTLSRRILDDAEGVGSGTSGLIGMLGEHLRSTIPSHFGSTPKFAVSTDEFSCTGSPMKFVRSSSNSGC